MRRRRRTPLTGENLREAAELVLLDLEEAYGTLRRRSEAEDEAWRFEHEAVEELLPIAADGLQPGEAHRWLARKVLQALPKTATLDGGRYLARYFGAEEVVYG